MGIRVGRGGAIPVPTQYPPQDRYYTVSEAQGPTYGQMKAILRLMDEVSQYTLRLTSD